MKDMIIKINVHLFVPVILTNFECMITLIGGQAIPLDRLFQEVFECKCFQILNLTREW